MCNRLDNQYSLFFWGKNDIKIKKKMLGKFDIFFLKKM